MTPRTAGFGGPRRAAHGSAHPTKTAFNQWNPLVGWAEPCAARRGPPKPLPLSIKPSQTKEKHLSIPAFEQPSRRHTGCGLFQEETCLPVTAFGIPRCLATCLTVCSIAKVRQGPAGRCPRKGYRFRAWPPSSSSRDALSCGVIHSFKSLTFDGATCARLGSHVTDLHPIFQQQLLNVCRPERSLDHYKPHEQLSRRTSRPSSKEISSRRVPSL